MFVYISRIGVFPPIRRPGAESPAGKSSAPGPLIALGVITCLTESGYQNTLPAVNAPKRVKMPLEIVCGGKVIPPYPPCIDSRFLGVLVLCR